MMSGKRSKFAGTSMAWIRTKRGPSGPESTWRVTADYVDATGTGIRLLSGGIQATHLSLHLYPDAAESLKSEGT